MSTRTSSIAVLQQKRIVELTEAWNKCKADNARLEAELREAQIRLDSVSKRWYSAEVTEAVATERDVYANLLREVLERNTPSLDLRERIKLVLSGDEGAAVGETQNAETQNH